MNRKEPSTVVGIDLTESEIRIIQMTPRNERPSVLRVASAPMPPSSFSNGRAVSPSVVAFAIRGLLDSMGAGQVENAVFGVPNGRTTYRQFVIPPVSDSEFDSVVDVEVEHHSLVRTQGGGYGAIKMQAPTVADRHDSVSVACFAVETDVTTTIQEIADKANLKVLALEPSTLAMVRTAVLAQPTNATIFNLAIGDKSSDISFLIGGHLTSFRRIDIGAERLCQESHSRVAVRQGSGGRGDGGFNAQDLNMSAVTDLALEVQRTRDYLQREYPDFALIDQIGISFDEPELACLAEVLSDRVSAPCFNVSPQTGSLDSPEASMELSGPQGSRFAVAYGLAMHSAPATNLRVPGIDLYGQKRTDVKQVETRRNFAGSILVSLLGVAVGVVGYFMYAQQITSADHETARVVQSTKNVKAETDQVMADRALHATQYRVLRKEGSALGVLMDYVVASLEPGVGLSLVSISNDYRVTFQGEATDEKGLLNTVENLKRTPLLKDLSIVSFSRPEKDLTNSIKFELSGTTLSANHIKLPPESTVRK
ncbi:MAG TPA: hypothetical protein VG944_05095 [Fimbriimonas sp.]|nr:hypothetical protein [Fimbriimonas sp.]